MNPTAPPSASKRLLREQIEKDAPARELSVATFMSGITAVCGGLALALGPLIGWKLSIALTVFLATLTAYYLLLRGAMKRGWYRPGVRWVNVAIEVSAPAVIFLVDAKLQGPAYALTAPPLVIWGTLVSLSGLRSSRALAIGAGTIAAAEYLLLYVFVALPALPAEALITLQPALFIPRVVLLFCSGLVTSVFVNHLNRRAEEALSAVRERDLLGKYVLHERIGAGGMAEVFRATYSPEGGFEKTVAIKKVLPAIAMDDAFVEMFRAEADLCSRLNHANIVQVFDFGRFKDTYFLAMEYVEGVTLQRLMRPFGNAGLPLSAVTFLAVEVCQALDYLHRRRGPDGRQLNLIHRDVNPSNLLVSMQGDVKLTDFGIARAATAARPAVTQLGVVRGKPGYFAPEQLDSESIDPRVDLFTLGITLWEAIVGTAMFPTTSDEASLNLVHTQNIPPPSLARRGVPVELDQIVLGLLQRQLNLRTATRSPGPRLPIQEARPSSPGRSPRSATSGH
jgi:eukaryotic-like serine/threonine-protein kinase